MELLFFSRACEGFNRRAAALNHGGDIVKVTCADFLLVADEGIALFARGEFGLLHLFHIVLHALTARISVGKFKGVVPIDVDASQSDQLVFVAHG